MRRRTTIHGFTALELTAVATVIALVTWLIIVPTLRARIRHGVSIRCVSHLKNAGLAARVFATDNEGRFPSRIAAAKGGCAEYFSDPNAVSHYFRSLSNELTTPQILICPSETRKPSDTFSALSNLNISYFVGWDSDETMPSSLLFGDRKLELDGRAASGSLIVRSNSQVRWAKGLHGTGTGNVAFGDGSVQQVSSSRFQEHIAQNSLTNRLLIP